MLAENLMVIKPDFNEWMRSMNLEDQIMQLVSAGFDDVENMVFIMQGSYPLTDERLEAVGIIKLGHR